MLTDLARLRNTDILDIVGTDTETTGFGSTSEIVSFALLGFTPNAEPAVLENHLVKPEVVTSWKYAQEVHGISPEDVAECAELTTHTEAISEAIAGKTVVAWNMKFDKPMFKGLLDTAGSTLCVMQAYKEWTGRSKFTKLTTAAEELDIPVDPSKAHDALYDTLLLMSITRELKDLLRLQELPHV